MKSELLSLVVAAALVGFASAQSIQGEVEWLIKTSCIHCHDETTETGLDLASLGREITDDHSFRAWERVFDRISSGEMPPATEDRPNRKELSLALDALQTSLFSASDARQKKFGRVPARRLTKLEFGYSIRDLLLIDNDVTSNLPDEVDAGTFDTVGANQRLSAVHLESYLDAVDQALKHAIQFGPNPHHDFGDHKEHNFKHLEVWHHRPLRDGGSVTRKLKYGRGVALFRDIDYLTQFTFGVRSPGTHRLTAKIAAFQSQKPITAKFIVKSQGGRTRMVRSVDLLPGQPQTVVVETFVQPGDNPYLTWDSGSNEGVFAAGGAKDYKGPGLAILSQRIDGPIFDSWPPPSTRRVFKHMLSDAPGAKLDYSKNADEHLTVIVNDLAPQIFRRRVTDEEILPFIDLAKSALEAGRQLPDAVKVALRSMLTSPQFLMFGGEPGRLDDFALANRLSYFLWKSIPDKELYQLASSGKLAEKNILSQQVERMLCDEKSKRFVNDFLGQWLWIHKVNATTPDDGLYPEFDELLANAIPEEPQLFFAEMIHANLSLTNFVDSDFAFVNRRLAEHYEIPDIKGQHFRKVELPVDSPRGGILTQAAILKTTANGTTTSPVMRGNFVLTNFLGTPPSPPPPGIGSIEPDTRGKTTIREILKAHRQMETCNQCHREIDPPGFALESFDPIGGFRTHYRADGGRTEFGGFVVKNPPKRGPPVDSSGVTAKGSGFSGIRDFKQLLFQEQEQIARNFISRLAVYATGGEIQFADRNKIEAILKRTSQNEYPVRDIIHEVVQSELFRQK